VSSVASSATSRIERTPARRSVKQGPDDGLLDGDQWVARSVVGRCPQRVAGPRGQLGCGHSLPAGVAGGEESTKLVYPLAGPVVGPAEDVPAECEASDADDQVPAADASRGHPGRIVNDAGTI